MAKHIFHYNTHAEKRYFLGREHHDLYDMIALSGNIVSHTPQGTAGFVATAAKDFYIDPQTHAFQHATIHLKRDVSDKEADESPVYEFKPSIIKLAEERLGEPFATVINDDRPLRPSMFFNDNDSVNSDIINRVCYQVGQFQIETMINELDDEAREFIGDTSNIRPSILIAPYFCLANPLWELWLRINIACYQRTKEIFSDLPVYFSLLVSPDTLNDPTAIIEALSDVKPDGIILWIDEHIEETLGLTAVRNYIRFLQKLKQQVTDTIYNSHGGYLSILLCHSETPRLLNGVGHAMNYGEHRAIVPIGGGIPMAQFYLLPVHSRLRFGDAASIVQPRRWLESIQSYRENICSCHQCLELINTKGSPEAAFETYGRSQPVTITRRTGVVVRLEYPTSEAKQSATRHYLYNKVKEFQDIEDNNFQDLLNQLSDIYDLISQDSGDDFVMHLPIWREALNVLLQDAN